MDINQMFGTLQQLAPQIASSYCVVNGVFMGLNEIENMGYEEFSLRSKMNMPMKLYKYFSNKAEETDGKKRNYSIEALKNNTVFMQAPSQFDDVYDSDINLDGMEYEKLRLSEYCRRCEIETEDSWSVQEIGNRLIQALMAAVKSTQNFSSAFTKIPTSKIEELSNEHFFLKLDMELRKDADLGHAVAKIISSDYEQYLSYLKNVFRVSCFATTPYSQLMWGGAYADCHRGFCVEYTILPNEEKYQSVYRNLFPMIYCKTRSNITDRLTALQDKEITESGLWDIYSHGALRKSIDWVYQNEWRLLLPLRCENISDYNIDFFPITKVFLGNRMDSGKRKEIIEICHERQIPYVGVMRNPSVFEMQECPVKCEECFRYNADTK